MLRSINSWPQKDLSHHWPIILMGFQVNLFIKGSHFPFAQCSVAQLPNQSIFITWKKTSGRYFNSGHCVMLLKPVQNGAKHFLKLYSILILTYNYFEGKQWSALLYDIIRKIKFQPANFEIFKTETDFRLKTVSCSKFLSAQILF